MNDEKRQNALRLAGAVEQMASELARQLRELAEALEAEPDQPAMIPLDRWRIDPTQGPLAGDWKEREATDLLVVHCSASRPHQNFGAVDIDKWHRDFGWDGIGYHEVICRDGTLEYGRPEGAVGAHAKGFNTRSIGVCLVGGVAMDGEHVMNFTGSQLHRLNWRIQHYRDRYPDIQVLGHRDLSPDKDGDGVVERHEWLKDCPCLDVAHFVETWEARF